MYSTVQLQRALNRAKKKKILDTMCLLPYKLNRDVFSCPKLNACPCVLMTQHTAALHLLDSASNSWLKFKTHQSKQLLTNGCLLKEHDNMELC